MFQLRIGHFASFWLPTVKVDWEDLRAPSSLMRSENWSRFTSNVRWRNGVSGLL